MLEQLHCSHARLFNKNDIEYFHLLESFGSAMSPKGTNSFLKHAGRGFGALAGFQNPVGNAISLDGYSTGARLNVLVF